LVKYQTILWIVGCVARCGVVAVAQTNGNMAMKKLIVMAAVVCAAVAAQAISITAKASGVYNAWGTGLYSGDVKILVDDEVTGQRLSFDAQMVEGAFETTLSGVSQSMMPVPYSYIGYTMTDVAGNLYRCDGSYVPRMDSQTIDFGSNGEWPKNPKPAPIPEPTSGLLLLLGMAGLALKRKQK